MKLGLAIEGIGASGRARIAERAARCAVAGVLQRIRARRSSEIVRPDNANEPDGHAGSDRT
jgi:hypothetical protein